MKHLIAVSFAVLISWTIVDIKGYRRGVADTEFAQLAERIVENRSEVVKAIYLEKGIEAAVQECQEAGKVVETKYGTFYLVCTLAGEFYDPATYKVVTTGKETILPVGMYMRVENGLDLLRKGQKIKDLDLYVRLCRDDPDKNPYARTLHYKSLRL